MVSDRGNKLSTFEGAAIALGRLINERPLAKRLQFVVIKGISCRCVRGGVGRRIYAEGRTELLALEPERGVILAANHRSFFDLWVGAHSLVGAAPWLQRVYFPVRADFFYDSPAGVLLNLVLGAGCMYPPVFRDASRSGRNEDSVQRMQRFLEQPGSLVGIHPEGRRNKGPDPYTLLPAQPGVGQLALQARPTIVPVFVNGLTNDVAADVKTTLLSKQARYTDPIVLIYGAPVDYSEFLTRKPRLTLYKRIADRIQQAIGRCGERERAVRRAIQARELDESTGWLTGPL